MDWIDLAWPWYYKELQTQSTNALDSMMYPKVQKSVGDIIFDCLIVLENITTCVLVILVR